MANGLPQWLQDDIDGAEQDDTQPGFLDQQGIGEVSPVIRRLYQGLSDDDDSKLQAQVEHTGLSPNQLDVLARGGWIQTGDQDTDDREDMKQEFYNGNLQDDDDDDDDDFEDDLFDDSEPGDLW